MSREQLREELAWFCTHASDILTGPLAASWGCGCDLDVAQMWQPEIVSASELIEHIARGEASGVFTLGSSDLWIEATDPVVELLFCHESDLHVSGDQVVIEAFRQRWTGKGYEIHTVK